MKDKISIIVPVYNVEKYLSECLDSIINQTYKNIEIILINDGSTDNSGKICDVYQKKDKRIKFISQANKGLSISRNNGMKIATGKYIMFVDSDDVIHSRMLEVLYKEIKNNKCQMAVCKFKLFVDKFEEKKIDYKVKIISQNEFFEKLMIDREITNHVCNKLYEKKLFNNIEFISGKKYEDVGTTYKVGFSLKKACYLNMELYGYRMRESSIVNAFKKETLLDYIEMTNLRYEDLLVRKLDIKKYLDMNRINSVVKYFILIAVHKQRNILKDKDIKEKLYNEIMIIKKLRTKEVIKINSFILNIASKLLILSPISFYYVVRFLYVLKNLKKVR